MFILSSVVAGLAVGFLIGGSLSRLASIPLRFSWLIILAFAVQVVLLSTIFDSPTLSTYVPWAYAFSNLLLLLAVVLNLHLKAIWALGLGLVLNLAVMAANGGFMPASLEQLTVAGHARRVEEIDAVGHSINVQALTPETRLAFLGDIFAIPSPIPLSNVFSIGDVLIGAGAFALVCGGMRREN